MFQGQRVPDRAPVMLIIDGVVDAPIVIDLGGLNASPSAPSGPVLAAVVPKLGADAALRLAAAVRDQRVSVDALRAVGLEVVYDPQTLELRISIPPLLTRQASHDLANRTPPEAAGALAPSDVSGYVNLRAGAGGNWRTAGETTTAPVHVNMDSALNIGGWVLEGRADVFRPLALDHAPLVVHRGDVLLSHDVPANAVRYLAGDFAVPFAGPQVSFPVLGIGAIRNFALQPYRVLQPVGSFDFVLDGPSTVTVLVNGAAVQTLTLSAGRHDVRDLPLAAGVNDIELVIKDTAGIERRVSFSTASPNELLAPGVVQFSLSLGFPLVADVDLRSYDFSRPILSGRRRWGVMPTATIGGSFDSTFTRHRAGAELAVATTGGNLAFDASVSCEAGGSCGHAETTRYDYTRGVPGTATAVALVYRHSSRGFHDMTTAPINRFSDEVSMLTTRPITRRLAARLNLRYQRGRDSPDARELAFGLSRSFGRLGMNALLTTRSDGITAPEARVFVTAQWVLPGHGSTHAVSRASTTTGVSNELTYSTSAGPPPGGLVSSITLKQGPGTAGASGSLGYTSDRFTSTMSADTSVDLDQGGTSQTAAVEVATALAFVGRRAAWSRPITGAFAMIARNPVLHGVSIEVNPALGGHAAQTDSAGLAVVPNLEAYRVGIIRVAAPTLQPGTSLGPESYVVLPTYKSGTLIPVGEEGTVFLRGTLRYSDGEPFASGVGEVVSLDHRERPAIPLMTNGAGRFALSGLTPGRYAIRLSGSAVAAAALKVPAGFSGVYSPGIITVARN